MVKKIQKNILLIKENYNIDDGSLFIDGEIIPFTKRSSPVFIEYNCEKCGKLHKQQLYKQILNILKKGLLCTKCRVKQTNLSKYGTECLFNAEGIKEKIKKTNLKRYGLENPAAFGTDKYNNKIKEKYSVNNVSQLDNVKEKKKQKYIDKYNVEYISQSSEIKDKIKQTNLIKYGSEYYLQSDISKTKTNNFRKNKTFNKFLKFDIQPLFSLEEWKKVKDKYQKLKWKCKTCGNEFEDYYANGRIPRCLMCFPYNTCSSKSEKEIFEYIKSLNVNVIENDRSILQGKELDIYIPNHNLAIEYNGLYWHSESYINDKNYHLNKTLECEKHNIQLLHIFEDEWLDKQEIVKNIIKMKLGVVDKKIGARKCSIKELQSKDTEKFLEENHIQGYKPAKVNIGLYYEDELVSLLTLGKPRYNKNYDWEIIRYSSLYFILGGFSKLLKYFTTNYTGSIITYSDRRLFDGRVYERNGFTKIEPTKPGYYYILNGNRYNRQQFQKHKLKDKLKLFNKDLTELENMQINGYDRIYDCGNNVFIKK